jgi:hypothetical protein
METGLLLSFAPLFGYHSSWTGATSVELSSGSHAPLGNQTEIWLSGSSYLQLYLLFFPPLGSSPEVKGRSGGVTAGLQWYKPRCGGNRNSPNPLLTSRGGFFAQNLIFIGGASCKSMSCGSTGSPRTGKVVAHHEWNNQDTIHPELVEGCFWSFARGSSVKN